MQDTRRAVGRYEILGVVGRGGMANVYLARQPDLERNVALKELSALRSSDPSFAKRFLYEARVAGSLSHPNIVVVHEYFQDDGVPYISMEYIERGSLRPHVGELSLAQISGVLEALLDALGAAEQRGIVHRDLKPENIMIASDGRVKVADFGIAKATGAFQTHTNLTAAGTAVGTPNYMAPEQAMAQDVGPWTDLYAVGMIAFELFIGHPPFADAEEPVAIALRQVNEPLPKPIELDPTIDPRISDWIEWLAAKKPSERPQTAAEAWDGLEDTIIERLGARWRRDALLLGLEGPENPPVATPTAPPRGAALEAFSPLPREPTTVPLAPAGMAETVAPKTRPMLADTQPRRAGKQPARRWLTGIKAGLAVAGVVALIAGALGAGIGGGGGSQPPDRAASGKSARATASSKPTSRDVPAATTQPAAMDLSRKTLAEQAKSARRLARQYQTAAARIEKLYGRVQGSNAELITALRETARAYRQASTAATRGDGAGLAASLATADQSKRAVHAAIGGRGAGGSGTSAQTQPQPQSGSSQAQSGGSSCSGDSQSDDPSDDSCEP